jgi:replication-associated recombination protein RarA
MICERDWYNKFGNLALDHFGRIHEPKRIAADSGWYKGYKYNYKDSNRTVYNHYFVNDLLGQRISITEQQYDNKDLTTPSTS